MSSEAGKKAGASYGTRVATRSNTGGVLKSWLATSGGSNSRRRGSKFEGEVEEIHKYSSEDDQEGIITSSGAEMDTDYGVTGGESSGEARKTNDSGMSNDAGKTSDSGESEAGESNGIEGLSGGSGSFREGTRKADLGNFSSSAALPSRKKLPSYGESSSPYKSQRFDDIGVMSEESEITSEESTSDYEEYRPSVRGQRALKQKRANSCKPKSKGTLKATQGRGHKNLPENDTNGFRASNHIKCAPLSPRDIYLAAAKYPDSQWRSMPVDDSDANTCIKTINSSHHLECVTSANIRDQGHITGMTLSPDGTMLATFSTVGVVRIWDLDTFKNIQSLRDKNVGPPPFSHLHLQLTFNNQLQDDFINEFYVGRFLPNASYLAAAGKLKDPKKWSTEDADNHIMPTPIKVFDVITGEVVDILNGHEEEVLCLEALTFKGENYLMTTSQDGYIMKWSMSRGWTKLLKSCRIEDGETCMAFNVAFLPNTGNRLFVASCDNHIALFDFETERKLQKFGEIYTCYCDHVIVVPCLELEPPKFPSLSQFVQDISIDIDRELSPEKLTSCFAYILSRGVEEVEEIDGVPISKHLTSLESCETKRLKDTQPNVVSLHKLKYITSAEDKFTLEEVKKYSHQEYMSNSWLIKIASNGVYVAAPTYEGSVFFFNIATGQCTAILRDHEGVEVRDVIFHPTRKLFFSCADDGSVKVYTQRTSKKDDNIECDDLQAEVDRRAGATDSSTQTER